MLCFVLVTFVVAGSFDSSPMYASPAVRGRPLPILPRSGVASVVVVGLTCLNQFSYSVGAKSLLSAATMQYSYSPSS